MRILLTGGTGLIGSHLVPELLTQGHEVVVLTRNAKPSKLSGLTFLAWDGRNVPPAVGNIDAVINLAGAGIADHRWTDAYKKEIMDSRTDATTACVRFMQAAAHKPHTFLSASAVGYYGTHRSEVLDESATAGNDFLSVVGKKWELAALGTQARTCILRTGLVLAREGGAFPKLLAPFKFYAGGWIGTGQQGFPWIHIEDEVAAIVYLLNHPTAKGHFNLAAPEAMTNRDFAELLGRLLGKPVHLPVPAFVVKTLLGESAMLVLEGQRVAPKHLLEAGFQFKYAQAEAAVRELLQ